MTIVIIVVVIIVVAAGGAYLAYSQFYGASSTTRATPCTGNTAVTFVTDFGLLGQHAPFFAAEKLGYYTQNCLTVTIQSGSGSSAAISAVASGSATFGYAAPTSLVSSYASNPGLNVQVVAQVLQTDIAAFFYISGGSNNITTPHDLVGKTIDVGPVANFGDTFKNAYLHALGLNSSDVTITNSAGNTNLNLLVEGKVDCAVNTIYAYTDLLSIAQQAGIAASSVKYFLPNLPLYGGPGVIASKSEMQSSPNVVSEFVNATLYGWKYALEYPTNATNILLGYESQLAYNESLGRLEYAWV